MGELGELLEQWIGQRAADNAAAADVDDAAAELAFEDDGWEPCQHEHDEECYDYQGFWVCSHTHCWNCGGCTCPGYCDDYQTYNLRPDETGGQA